MRILVSGIGGGLDVVNALPLYFAMKEEGHSVTLGSVRSAEYHYFQNAEYVTKSVTRIKQDTQIEVTTAPERSRYPEATLARLLNEDVVLLSRREDGVESSNNLANAIDYVAQDYDVLFFVDAGGDSLIMRCDDANSESETKDPFSGGDAITLAALSRINTKKQVYQAIIAPGLDIDTKAFHANIDFLQQKNAYYGAVNVRTGEKDGYLLDSLCSWTGKYRDRYSDVAEQVLALTEIDAAISASTPNSKRTRWQSHTAIIAYYALTAQFGLRRTYMPWEPTSLDGKKGVNVTAEHCWMYVVDPRVVESEKLRIRSGSR